MSHPARRLFSPGASQLSAKRWLIAYSGGLDSTVLLSAAIELRRQYRSSAEQGFPELLAVHVNHGLADDAGAWVLHCAQWCEAHSVPLSVRCVEVLRGPGESPEAAARRVRYEVFTDLLQPDDLLLQGHHLDDQLETFFLRLLRGSGPRGLTGIPTSRALGHGEIWRPLLALERAQLLSYAKDLKLDWIEDPSNAETEFDRNYLRHEVLPALARRWPQYRASMASSMELLSAQEQYATASVTELLSELDGVNERGVPYLRLPDLLDSGTELAGMLIRSWLQLHSLSSPGKIQLEEFMRQLLESDGARLQAGSYVLQRYDEAIYLLMPTPKLDIDFELPITSGARYTIPGIGVIELIKCRGEGLRAGVDDHLTLRSRRGGERCRPATRQHSQLLKKLLQEYRVAPWLRENIPLVYRGDQLVAVGDLWVCYDNVAKGDEFGVVIRWQPENFKRYSAVDV
ncbi:MAG: tRNA(Ile)-lysidine synthase [Halieaceae bacterium]